MPWNAEPPVVYGLALSEDELLPLQHVLHPHCLITSLGAAPQDIAEHVAIKRWDRLEAAGALVKPLVRTKQDIWPKTAKEASQIMCWKPNGLRMWHLRNLLWVAATKSLVFMVDALASQSLDLTMHLTAAKLLGATSIGIMPSELRTTLDTTQLTMVDVVVGEADTRSLSCLLLSLTVEPPTLAETKEEAPAKG